MFAAALLIVSLLPTTILGLPAYNPHAKVVRRQLTGPPSGFIKGGDANDDDLITLSLALPQSNVAGLHAAVLAVSDPSSANYGKHYSKADVDALVAPKPESVAAVTSWLNKNGIAANTTTGAGDVLRFTIPVSQANTLLDAQFKSYVHTETNTTTIRTLSYALPAALQEHVAYVYPTTHFLPPVSKSAFSIKGDKLRRSRRQSKQSPRLKRQNIPDFCETEVHLVCLQELYNVPTDPATQSSNTLFVAGFDAEIGTQQDLETFLSADRPDIDPNQQIQFLSVDGVQNFNGGTAEGSLDIQTVVGLATNVPVTYISIGSPDTTFFSFFDMVAFMLQQDSTPSVFSMSYGSNESPDSETVGFSEVAETICNAYAQLGLRGTSVLVSSGDEGVAGALSGEASCLPDGSFRPSFPSTCPFVTSVGAAQSIPEVAAPYSSGGFSIVFPRPSYQDDAVTGYLNALGTTNQGLFNTTGRAFPDISAQGTNYSIAINGVTQLVSGTSAAAPAVAAIVSLLNDRLLSAGQPPLGFLNPLLYAAAAQGALNDVVGGSNPGGADSNGCGTDGFPALEGWDAATGLGTPNFAALLQLALADPTRTPPDVPTSSLAPIDTASFFAQQTASVPLSRVTQVVGQAIAQGKFVELLLGV
ncbi:family S53 protease [Epithele typhae]|uniref:family S53 protease n=1 Tax=Epithele typhae TaxID=378194 RepID=UPI0020074DDE|nr:family S53 protease [Epithele typhae]KAH9941646.1 family S53 protease [Epithele typhae]